MRILSILCLAMTLAACGTISRLGGGEPDPNAPAPLADIEQPVELDRVWSKDFGAKPKVGGVHLHPVLVGPAVFVADTEGKVSAYERETGKELWRTDLDTGLSGGVGYGDGLVVVATVDGVVHALEGHDGAPVWESPVAGEVLSPPAGDRGTIVVRTVDGRVIGLSSADGARRWSYARDVPSLTLRGSSRPLIARGAAIIGFPSGKVVGNDLDSGRIYWDIPVTVPSGRNEIERLADLEATPLLIGDVLYVAAYQNRVTAIDLGNQRILWTRELSSYRDMAADARRVFVAAADGRVHALSREDGSITWTQDGLARRRLSGVTTLGRWVVVGDDQGYVHFLSRESGQFGARIRVDSPVDSTPISDGEQVYVIGGGDRITAIRPATG